MDDLYALLGVPRDGTQQAIEKAWKKQARALHPDGGGGDASRLSAINAAHDILKDPAKRQAYDREYTAWSAGRRFARAASGARGGTPFDDLFADLFGTPRGASPPQGNDVSVRVHLPLSTALGPADISLDVEGKTVRVRIPAGTPSGAVVRARGKGRHGPEGAGDLRILVEHEQHPVFQRSGTILVCPRLPVPMPTAALGGTLVLTGLDGQEIKLTVPEGAQTGDVITAPGAGFPPPGGGPRGALSATLFVETPTHLTDAERALFGRLAKGNTRSAPQSKRFLDGLKALWRR